MTISAPPAPSEQPSQTTSFVSQPAKRWRLTSLVWITLLWVAIYIPGMFSPALLDDADSKHAEVAREMVLRHDWVTLYTNGIRYMEKAPLMYWSVAASFRIFGVSEWSARLPVVLWILGLLYGTYWLGTRAFGERGGFFSAVVMATSLGPYLFTRFLIPDTLVGLWLLLGFGYFLRTLEEDRPSRLSCWGIAVTAALAVLTKGLIGIVFPIAVIGLYLILTGNLRHLLKLRLLSSTLVFVLVAAPWHVLAALHNPDQGQVRGFLWFYFINEQVLRYLNKRVPRDYDTVPLLLFWGLLVLWVLPWCAFLPQAIRELPMRLRALRSRLTQQQKANLVFLLWALVIVVFFSFSTRQEYYTLPGIPAVALLIGGWLAKETESAPASVERRVGRISSAVLFAVGAIACAIGMLVLLSSQPPAAGTDLADLLRQHPQDYALSMGHFLDLTPQAMGAFRGPLLGFSLAFVLGTGANWWFRRRQRPAAGNMALAVMMVALLTCVHAAFVTFSPILSSKELALAIEKEYRPGNLIVVDGEYESACTLNFYTGVPLRILHVPSSSLWYGSRFPDAPRVFETPQSFASLWDGPNRVFLWSEKEQPSALQGKPAFLLARSGGKFILTNQRP